jgi:hypothetical protein
MPETDAGIEDELNRLRARVAELEKKAFVASAAEGKSKAAEDDLLPQITNVAAGLLRGLTLAAIEEARLIGTTLQSFADEVMQHNVHERKDRGVRELLADLPGDVLSGLRHGVRESLSMPEKVIDRFRDSYKETR